jgi:hypothetical protein
MVMEIGGCGWHLATNSEENRTLKINFISAVKLGNSKFW